MSPDSPVFARMTIGATRINLGHGPTAIIFTRATEQLRKQKHRAEMVIQIEMSPTKLEDSTTFSRVAILEQEFSDQLLKTKPEEESPYPGITIARVVEVMDSEEFKRYQFVCQAENRFGLTQDDVDLIKSAYFDKYPDCAPHFPGWVG